MQTADLNPGMVHPCTVSPTSPSHPFATPSMGNVPSPQHQALPTQVPGTPNHRFRPFLYSNDTRGHSFGHAFGYIGSMTVPPLTESSCEARPDAICMLKEISAALDEGFRVQASRLDEIALELRQALQSTVPQGGEVRRKGAPGPVTVTCVAPDSSSCHPHEVPEDMDQLRSCDGACFPNMGNESNNLGKLLEIPSMEEQRRDARHCSKASNCSRGSNRFPTKLSNQSKRSELCSSQAPFDAIAISSASFKPSGRSVGADTSGADEEWVDGETRLTVAHRRFSRHVKSTRFDYTIGAIIVLNTIFLGIQIDSKARSLLYAKDSDVDSASNDSRVILITETVFAVIFLLELIARMIAFHRRFPFSFWNIFDFVVVMAAVLEECLKYGIGGDTIAVKLSVFRMMRVFKLLRTLRIIRVVRVFRELRIVLASMMAALRQLVWTLFLLMILIYMVSVLILTELTSKEGAYHVEPPNSVHIGYFSDLPRSLVTMFQCTTFGLPWERVTTSLEPFMPWISGVWVLYMGFVVFAFMNTVTGLFVDEALKSSQDDHRNVMLEEVNKREELVKRVTGEVVAASGGGAYINSHALRNACRQECFQRCLKEFDIDSRDVFTFFDMVADSGHCIQREYLEGFIRGCFRLKGKASNTELVALAYKLNTLQK